MHFSLPLNKCAYFIILGLIILKQYYVRSDKASNSGARFRYHRVVWNMQQFLNKPAEERFTDSWAFLMNYINSIRVVLWGIIRPLRCRFQQPTLKQVFLSSLVVRQGTCECTTYRLPRCQLQTVIEQSKQKERLSSFVLSAFKFLLELLLIFVFPMHTRWGSDRRRTW